MEPNFPSCQSQKGKAQGPERRRSSIKIQRKQQAVTRLRDPGQEGGAVEERQQLTTAAARTMPQESQHAPSDPRTIRCAGPPRPATRAATAQTSSPTPPYWLQRNFLFKHSIQDGGLLARLSFKSYPAAGLKPSPSCPPFLPHPLPIFTQRKFCQPA